jgi:hypothetical protein
MGKKQPEIWDNATLTAKVKEIEAKIKKLEK